VHQLPTSWLRGWLAVGAWLVVWLADLQTFEELRLGLERRSPSALRTCTDISVFYRLLDRQTEAAWFDMGRVLRHAIRSV
jgi:hypothetical protein